MKMKSMLLPLSVMILVLSGCGSTASFSRLNEGVSVASSTKAEAIKVFAATEIGREYIQLGSVSFSSHGELNGKVYVQKIKEAAAKIGADAIVAYEQYGTSASGIAVKYR
jgi:hypothetical protein